MQNSMRSKGLRRLGAVVVAGLLNVTLAWAQPSTAESGRYILRASAIPSESLPAQSASNYGIEAGADRGILNVVVLENVDGAKRPVAAEVSATRLNLLGQPTAIEMREVRP